MSENKSRTLPDIFKKLDGKLGGTSLEIFNSATNVTLKISREQRIAEVGCTLAKLYPKKEIYALETKIKEAYELSFVRILTHYDKELFAIEYMSEIFIEAARVGIVINGFFNKYKIGEVSPTL